MQQIILPLPYTCLNEERTFRLGKNCIIEELPIDYLERIKQNKLISARYEKILKNIEVGLKLTLPKKMIYENVKKTGIFCSMLVRLSTGIPIDVPFFYYWPKKDGEMVYGETGIRTFVNIKRNYIYPFDQGNQRKSMDLLSSKFDQFLDLFLKEGDKNRIIRAILFASVGFQTHYIPTRLVNLITFLETLFTTTRYEITFQLASRISWYLSYNNSAEEREKKFDLVKEIYNIRSNIVHGGSISNLLNVRKILEETEDLNTMIFNKIMEKDHVKIFSSSKSIREEQFKKLSLGLPCDLIPYT